MRTGDYFFKSGGELGLAASAANYVSAALRKDPQANFNMALAYSYGSGVPVDRELAGLFFQDTIKFDKRAAWPIFFTKLWIGWRESFILDSLTSFLMVIFLVVIVVSGTILYKRHTIRLRRRVQQRPNINQDARQENPIIEREPPIANEQPAVTIENEQADLQQRSEPPQENVDNQIPQEGIDEIIPQAESHDQVSAEHTDHSSDYVTTEEEEIDHHSTPTIQTD